MSKSRKLIRIKGVLPSIATLLLIASVMGACKSEKKEGISELEVVLAWSDMALHVTQYTPLNSPTFASRGFGYIGLTMYESIVQGYPSHRSLVGQLNNFPALPLPEAEVEYDWLLSFNAAQAFLLKNIYQQTSTENKLRIDSLEQAIGNELGFGLDQYAIDQSIAYGRDIAGVIFEWSKTDGGHRGYLNNFDKDMIHPSFPGSWKPPLYAQSFSHHPLHPHWGNNRTFLIQNANLQIPEMIPYDTLENSDYYQQFLQVYEKDLALTQKEKEAAIWWGDDPDVSFTPPGHSFFLASQIIQKERPSMMRCAETYARVGMAVADAFINCWKWKYHYFSERPNTFIPRFIDQEWVSFWPDPPFPSFPSGHAIQAAAFATAMEGLYGKDPISFSDSSHVARDRDELRDVDFVARSFESFWDVAQETADSRFYGGIHTAQDNQVGLEEGVRIATNVNELIWRNEK